MFPQIFIDMRKIYVFSKNGNFQTAINSFMAAIFVKCCISA